MLSSELKVLFIIPLLFIVGTSFIYSGEKTKESGSAAIDTKLFSDVSVSSGIRKKTRFYQSHKVSRQLKIKGWQVSEGIYLSRTKVLGDYGAGLVVMRDNYSWGFNHRGMHLHIPLD